MEIFLEAPEYFEHEKSVRCQINLNTITESTTAAPVRNRKLVYRISTINDILSCKKLPGAPIKVFYAQTIPENFVTVVHFNIRDICLEINEVPNLILILERPDQKIFDIISI